MSFDDELSVCVVHNGIIENYLELRKNLEDLNYKFESQTDSEVIAHLLHYLRKNTKTLLKAVVELQENFMGLMQ